MFVYDGGYLFDQIVEVCLFGGVFFFVQQYV